MYYLLTPDKVIAGDIDGLVKICDTIPNSIVVDYYGPTLIDFSIIYIQGESKVLSNVK